MSPARPAGGADAPTATIYLLFALRSLTAVFASPALAAPPVPRSPARSPAMSSTRSPIVSVNRRPADSVQVTFSAASHSIRDSRRSPATCAVSSRPISVTMRPCRVLDQRHRLERRRLVSTSVWSRWTPFRRRREPSWLSPNDERNAASGEISLRTITVAEIDSVQYFVDGEPIGQASTPARVAQPPGTSRSPGVRSLGERRARSRAHVGAVTAPPQPRPSHRRRHDAGDRRDLPGRPTIVPSRAACRLDHPQPRRPVRRVLSRCVTTWLPPRSRTRMIWQAPLNTTAVANEQIVSTSAPTTQLTTS